jgi:hypothetical protein
MMRSFATILLVTLAGSSLAVAEFKPFSSLPKASVENRVVAMLNVLRTSIGYSDLESYQRATLFYSAAGIIAERQCTEKRPNSQILVIPKWFDPISSNIGVNELRTPSTNTASGRQLRLLTWALVGLVADDNSPCEAAEYIYKSAERLN